MSDKNPVPEEEKKEGAHVVYSRLSTAEDEKPAAGESVAGKRAAMVAAKALGPLVPVERGSYAPALTPLLVGFTLLVALVLVLGFLSVRELESISAKVSELARQNAAKRSLLLNLQVALTKLNNEARARADAEARGGVVLPFGNRLRTARNELSDVKPDFERLPLAQTERGVAFSRNLSEFAEMTQDLDRYSREGFEKFRTIEAELENFQREASREQEDITEQRDRWQKEATRDIYITTVLAVVTGLLVAGATGWEVQRRFRQLRRSLETVRRERQFSTQMLEGMVSAVAAIDKDDCIRSANAAFFEVFPQATIGASVHDKNITSLEGTRLLVSATATRVERAAYRGRWVLGTKLEDTPRTFDVYSSPLEIDGERGQIITLVDVTEAVEAEAELRQQESLAAVGQAAAQVAHEIKNPLGSIRLGVTILRDMITDEAALETINLVDRGIDHLNKLTVDVTQFSRQRELERAEVDLHEVLDASLDLVTDKIREKSTPVEKNFSAGPLRAECDADQLRQVFVNLFANAVDASADGSPVTISTERVTGERRRRQRGDNGGRGRAAFARISVADQGSGMDEATRARIFEPFFTTKKRGTGLGLAIAKRIVEQHGGLLTVESAPGQGTRFTIDLPLIDGASSGK